MGRSIFTLMLGVVAIASPASSQPATAPLPGAVAIHTQTSREQLPQPVRDAIAPYDAQCRAAGGNPGKSPDLVKIADVTRDLAPDYVVDFNAYECLGAPIPNGQAGAALMIYSMSFAAMPSNPLAVRLPPTQPNDPAANQARREENQRRLLAAWIPGPTDHVERSYTLTVYASRISTVNGLAVLTLADAADCGRPDAANILHARWEWCAREYGRIPYPLVHTGLKPGPSLSVPGERALVAGNFAEAARLFAAGAEQGDAQSMLSLGSLLAEGKKGVPKDEARAFVLYRKAAEAVPRMEVPPLKSPQELAEEGITKAELLRRQEEANAVNDITAQAMLQVALSYEKGSGVARDPAQAALWFKRWAVATDNDLIREQRAQTLAEHNIRL